MIKIFKIRGNSLFPLYKDKQIILALDVRFFKLKPKDVVVFFQKDYSLMVKQIQKIQGDKYFLTGTSPDSIDSKSFGLIDKKDIKYKVLCAIM